MKITGNESNTYILKELGNRLKEIRVNAGITQEEMSERSGLSLSSVRRIENGDNVKIENILNIMRALSLIGNLEVVIPEQIMSPSMNLDVGKKRQRAVSKKKNTNSEWKWGEDK